MKNKRDCLGNERKLASFAEAWIENNFFHKLNTQRCSPPSRRRGLKKRNWCKYFSWYLSPPSRRRGLKNENRTETGERTNVASFAEAWIEKQNMR